MNVTKEQVKKYVSTYNDDYYVEQVQGEYVGDINRLIDDIESLYPEAENVDEIIRDMIETEELIEDKMEWKNPEIVQHTTSYVDVIYVAKENDK